MPAEFEVRLARGLDVAGSLELFRRSGDDLIDRWDGRRLVRAVPLGRGWVAFVARLGANHTAATFNVCVAQPEAEADVRAAVASTLVPAPDHYRQLLAEDAVMAALEARSPGIRQVRQLDLFTALIRCISAQQVNLRWAVTTRRRLAETFGVRHEIDGEVVYTLDPQRIAETDPTGIRALQFTTSKSVAIVAAAQTLVDEKLTTETLSSLTDDEVIARLTAIRGIGRWSAEWILARTLGRPRVVAGDLGVRKAVGLAYLDEPLPSEAQVREATRHWGPSAGTAQAVLLYALGEGRLPLNPAPGPPRSRAASRP